MVQHLELGLDLEQGLDLELGLELGMDQGLMPVLEV